MGIWLKNRAQRRGPSWKYIFGPSPGDSQSHERGGEPQEGACKQRLEPWGTQTSRRQEKEQQQAKASERQLPRRQEENQEMSSKQMQREEMFQGGRSAQLHETLLKGPLHPAAQRALIPLIAVTSMMGLRVCVE